ACGFPFPKEEGYSLPDWLVDTTSGATGEAVGEAKTQVDFAGLWAKSPSSEAYLKAHGEEVQRLKANPVNLKTLPTKGPGQLKALQTLLAYRMTKHYKSAEFLGPR
ncbi:unnamed protein product, partial [Polarella glacialis]